MNERLKKQFDYLGSGSTKEALLEVLESLKAEVADVRTTLSVKPEIETAVRLGVIQIIDEKLINRLRQNPTNKELENYS